MAKAWRMVRARSLLLLAPGGHDGGYWSGRWGEYLSFYAQALARCR